MADVKLVIAVCSCTKHRDRQVACVDTWFGHARRLPGVEALFFTGQSPYGRSGAMLHLDCNDEWLSLPLKVGRMLKHVHQHFPRAWLFKCDDDTLLMPERLLEFLPGAGDYSGCGYHQDGTTHAQGGAGYLLSPRAIEALLPQIDDWSTGYEDLVVGKALNRAGIGLVHDDRFVRFGGVAPTAESGRITEHYVWPALMRHRWLQYHVNGGRPTVPAADLRPVLELAGDYSDASGCFGGALPAVFGIALGCRAARMLEIGVNRGGSTRALLTTAGLTGGHLTSIDIGDCSQAIPPEIRGRWTFLQGDSRAVLPRLVGQGARFDFALIDGEHTYERVQAELELIERLLVPRATVLLDDCWHDFQGVLDAFNLYRPQRPARKSLIPYGSAQSWGGVARTFGLLQYE